MNTHPVVLFDGVCCLCEGSVRFIVRHDPRGLFRFAPLDSPAGRRLLENCATEAADARSVVLVVDGICYTGSEAAWRIAARLSGAWSWLAALRLVPRPVRDGLYRLVAARRYAWFGRRQSCLMPPPEWRDRFLET
jgi:predicted DCC family thiol-disulfide oxidoreductase YuxK